jgi:hypothetical protein
LKLAVAARRLLGGKWKWCVWGCVCCGWDGEVGCLTALVLVVVGGSQTTRMTDMAWRYIVAAMNNTVGD